MPSKHFEALEKGVELLREHLLPESFDPTGSYSEHVLTRALAFRVLAHAEIETYFEARVLEASRDALKHFQKEGGVRRALIALLAFSGSLAETPPDTLSAPQPNQEKHWNSKIELEEKLRVAVNAFDRVVKNNHGVKESNLLRLLLPVGIKPADLDPNLLSNISAFGENRGDAAHSSVVSVKTRQPPDPESEYNTVKALLADLIKLDECLDALLM